MNAESGRGRPVGRPPGPHDDTLAKILPTALELFLREGGSALTPTRLHRETGVSRATIYRNWPEPADLIEIMLHRATDAPDDVALTGDLSADLRAAMASLQLRFEHRPVRALFAACLEHGRHSERVAAAAEVFIAGLLEPFQVVIAAAIESGELSGSADDLVAELVGPVILGHVVLGRPVDRARAQSVVDHFLGHHVTA